MIGLGGFGFDFREQSKEFSRVFSRAFGIIERHVEFAFRTFQAIFPLFRFIPTRHASDVSRTRQALDDIGRGLIEQTKTIFYSQGSGEKAGGGSSVQLEGRDILSVLIRANISDVPEKQQLSDYEMIDQIPTFIVAGSDTTSTAISWLIYALSQEPKIQNTLRNELLSLDTCNPSMDQLNSLPYLDKVVRECLRLHPPVGQIVRQATQDDVLPLGKPITDMNGKIHDHVRIRKGQNIMLHILALNSSEEHWGPDACKFNPKRWTSLPETAKSVPGAWGNLSSFSAGPRSCIGFRFALAEMKSILFALIRAFEFELAVDAKSISRSPSLISKPQVEEKSGRVTKLPVIVRQYARL
ncbi:cytochrome P450 [Flagelloscypha sp. PMI_526]|nr:cytochrome P450 [Flagelloscypha sp. PMI_526]